MEASLDTPFRIERKHPSLVDIYSGPCGDLKYIFIGSLGGTIEYFDASGVLVAAERYNDVPGYCDETSFNIWYGLIPDCTRDPRNIWENFCKGSGYKYCALVSDCGSLDESECLSRYNNLQCWADSGVRICADTRNTELRIAPHSVTTQLAWYGQLDDWASVGSMGSATGVTGCATTHRRRMALLAASASASMVFAPRWCGGVSELQRLLLLARRVRREFQ